MGLFSRSRSNHPAASSLTPIDHGVPDDEWLTASNRAYIAEIDQHYGTPETMATPGKDHYGHQNFGVALFFYAKSIDMLQTAYCFNQMRDRQPSPADTWIVDGFVNSLGASLAMHADAPVGEVTMETMNMLRSIAEECQRTGVSDQLYASAVDKCSTEVRAGLS